jgi:mRNA-degrading endonuclease RelE of RelBE toxin-antitoxin system
MAEYSVELTPTAEKLYRKMHEDAQVCIGSGDTSNARVKLLRAVDDAIDHIIPHDPFSIGNALSGSLSNIFRAKKGRLRIYYAASSKEHRIVILYISETLRKAGDAHDPYSVFARLVLQGKFNEVFASLGVRKDLPPAPRMWH